MQSQLAVAPRSNGVRAHPTESAWATTTVSVDPFDDGTVSLAASRVMLVDDERGNLFLLTEILHRAGLTDVSSFREPEEALEAAIEDTPDLILLDIMMPRLDGYAFLDALHHALPDADVPPVLMMTGNHSTATKLHALDAGATDFVTKPFDSSELLLRIRNALRTRALQKQIREQNERLEMAVQERTRQLEEALLRAESAARAKAEFLAKMSHELKTPLTPLLGALEMLAEADPSVESGRLIELASRSANRMNGLVGDILLMQRLEQGGVRLDITPVRLVPMLRDVLQPFSEEGAAEIRLVVEPASERATLNTDETRLGDVVRRIVENAVRFSPPGSTVTVGVEAGELDAGVAITVADEGPGIPEDRRVAVFSAFEQADNSAVRRHNGAGLGLAICRGLCDLLGASLAAFDRAEGGTLFRIVFGSHAVHGSKPASDAG